MSSRLAHIRVPFLIGINLLILGHVYAYSVLDKNVVGCVDFFGLGTFLGHGRITAPVRLVKLGHFTNCGACAQACPTRVPIKREVENNGFIRDLNCMDCVAACPANALAMKPTRFASRSTFERIPMPTSQPLVAETAMLWTAVPGFFFYRGKEFGEFLAIGRERSRGRKPGGAASL